MRAKKSPAASVELPPCPEHGACHVAHPTKVREAAGMVDSGMSAF